jgi:hypothetical protein
MTAPAESAWKKRLATLLTPRLLCTHSAWPVSNSPARFSRSACADAQQKLSAIAITLKMAMA